MSSLTRRVSVGGKYKELWSDDYKLKIEYEDQSEIEAIFDEKWRCMEKRSDTVDTFVRSSAYFAEKLEKFSPELLNDVCGDEVKTLIPEELLRQLLDDCALPLDAALTILLDCFGETLSEISEKPWLRDIQPRTFALTEVLRRTLDDSFFAYHDAYSEAFRYPLGAVESETEIRFRVFCSNVTAAVLEVYGDDLSMSVPMSRDGKFFSCTYTPQCPAALWYRFRLQTARGEKLLCPDSSGNRGIVSDEAQEVFRLTVYCRGFETPEWLRGKIMYQIFPDRFGFTDDGSFERGVEYHRSLGQTPDAHESISEPVKWLPREGENDYAPDDFYGGNLRGIAEKLPYLKELGVGIIYLNPIVEARSNHRYDTADYSRVDPILGTNEDYTALCEKAKALGIRIINDGVFSHTGADSVYFNRNKSYATVGAYQGEGSEFYKWFDFRAFPDDYRCWWGFKDLPEVNELDESWQDHIIKGKDSIVKKWLRLGASGWRLDVADELPDEVLSLIRSSAKEEKPDAFILGEVWEDAVTKQSYGARRNYALGYSLDSVMNYPLRRAIIDFALGKISAFELRDHLLSQKMNYPEPMYLSLMNLLSSHDVERISTALAAGADMRSLPRERQLEILSSLGEEDILTGKRLHKLCAVVQYMLPGIPSLYYGDEECLQGGTDPFNRAPFEPTISGLFDFYSKLGKIRNENEALRSGELSIETPAPDVIILRRKCNTQEITAVINRGECPYEHRYKNLTPLLFGYGDTLPAKSAEIYTTTPKA